MTAVAVMTLLLGTAVLQVLGEDTPLVEKGTLGFAEADPVLFLIGEVLTRIPLEGDRRHGVRLT